LGLGVAAGLGGIEILLDLPMNEAHRTPERKRFPLDSRELIADPLSVIPPRAQLVPPAGILFPRLFG
jgi:hypothetical protein